MFKFDVNSFFLLFLAARKINGNSSQGSLQVVFFFICLIEKEIIRRHIFVFINVLSNGEYLHGPISYIVGY